MVPSIKIFINSKPFFDRFAFGRSSKCSSRHAETKKMFDIKDIAPADNSIGDWWKYVLIVALILGIEF
jgi:hypothetical protein